MNPVTLPAPGFHYGVPYEVYASWPAANFSRIKTIRGTPSKCKHAIDNPKPMSPAMILGSSLHVATLEPARFEQLFYVRPECDRRTKEGKEIYAKAVAQANGRQMLEDGEQIGMVRDMARAIQSSRAAQPFLNCTGQNEVCALWHDDETGLMCKARFDRLIPKFDLLGRPVVFEIKTSRDAEPFAFGRDCNSHGYAAQAASYAHAVKKITGEHPAHVFVVVENFPPHDLIVYMLDDAGLQTGLLQYRQMLSRYAECVKTGIWPGFEDKVHMLSLPKWANEEVLSGGIGGTAFIN